MAHCGCRSRSSHGCYRTIHFVRTRLMKTNTKYLLIAAALVFYAAIIGAGFAFDIYLANQP